MKNEEPPKLQCRVLTSYEKVFCSACLTPEIPLTDGMIHAFDGARGENIAFQLAFKFPSSSIQMTIRLESELAEHVTLREVAHVPCELRRLPPMSLSCATLPDSIRTRSFRCPGRCIWRRIFGRRYGSASGFPRISIPESMT